MTTYIHGIPARFYTSGEIRLVTTYVDGNRLISDEELQEIIDAAWKRYQAFLANEKKGQPMSIETMIAQLQSVAKELAEMKSAQAQPVQPAVNPLPPLPHQPQPQPQPAVSAANWMAQYQSDCLLWATALQHGVVTQHPDSNEYRHGNYNWPDREKAMAGQQGTPTRPGGTSGNQPRAI